MTDSEPWEKAEILIRGGDFSQARPCVAALLKQRWSRPERVRLAEFCRRVGWSEHGVRLLHRVVRPSPRSPSRPRPAEQAEYAACLNRMGAHQEALRLLQDIPAARAPQALLFEAYVHMHRWDYELATIRLEEFLVRTGRDSYLGQIGLVNLSASLVNSGHYEAARKELGELIERTQNAGNRLLLANACELSAQNELRQGRGEAAEVWLQSASSALRRTRVAEKAETTDSLYIRQWKAVCDLQGETRKSVIRKRLAPVRDDALRLSDLEALRHCDLLEAQQTGDQELLVRLWFGTPHPGFRKMVQAELEKRDIPLSALESFHWCPGEEAAFDPGAKGIRLLDLETGHDNGGASLKVGQVPHRLLVALCSDFYRPLRLTELHGLVFPDRNYNPGSSPFLVYQAIRRLEEWLERSNAPAEIIRRGGLEGFQLKAHLGFAFRIPGSREIALSRLEGQLVTLRAGMGRSLFANRDVQAVLGMSRRSAQYFLKAGTDKGKLERVGEAARARYRFSGN